MRFMQFAPAPKGARRIFLAMPAYGDIPALASFCLARSIPALNEAGFEAELCILTGHCHVDDARNLIVQQFLDSDCDELLFLDADVGYQAEDLIRLCSIERDMVAGVYRLKNDFEQYPCQMYPGEVVTDDDGLLSVRAVPTGFLKIHRRVFQAMQDTGLPAYRPDNQSPTRVTQFFAREIDDTGARIGGDVAFCHRHRCIGGEIWVDPELWLEHAGVQVWHGSLGTWLRRISGADLTGWLQRIHDLTNERNEMIPLVREWGNDQFVGSHEFLMACIDIARQAEGPIIEAGSGLSSLVMAAAGAEVWCLESDPVWLSVLGRHRSRNPELLDGLKLIYAPLAEHAGGRWYAGVDAALLPWRTADLVVIDGPARRDGNRSIIFDVMRDNDCNPRLILADDPALLDLPRDRYRFETAGLMRQFAIGRIIREQAAA